VRIPDTANIQCPPEDEHVMLETCRGPLLIGAKYGSIQSVRIPDTANIQCRPEDEHVMLETCRGS
jgi:copper(I)-binding protein